MLYLMFLAGTSKCRGIWGDPEYQPCWWPANVIFGSPTSYRKGKLSYVVLNYGY